MTEFSFCVNPPFKLSSFRKQTDHMTWSMSRIDDFYYPFIIKGPIIVIACKKSN